MTNAGPFLWNGSSKIQFCTDFSTFSVGGCGGQPMLLFYKIVKETQMSTPPEATRQNNLTTLLVLLPLRTNSKSTFQYETPCTIFTKCACRHGDKDMENCPHQVFGSHLNAITTTLTLLYNQGGGCRFCPPNTPGP